MEGEGFAWRSRDGVSCGCREGEETDFVAFFFGRGLGRSARGCLGPCSVGAFGLLEERWSWEGGLLVRSSQATNVRVPQMKRLAAAKSPMVQRTYLRRRALRIDTPQRAQ
jgi:hypothetical protein